MSEVTCFSVDYLNISYAPIYFSLVFLVPKIFAFGFYPLNYHYDEQLQGISVTDNGLSA